jgi:hypothetical protein
MAATTRVCALTIAVDVPADTGTLLRYEGTSWEKPSNFSTAESICVVRGFAADDVWIGGSCRLVAHFNGRSWSYPNLDAVTNMTTIFQDVGGSSPHDVWFPGFTGPFRWDEAANALVGPSAPYNSVNNRSWTATSGSRAGRA